MALASTIGDAAWRRFAHACRSCSRSGGQVPPASDRRFSAPPPGTWASRGARRRRSGSIRHRRNRHLVHGSARQVRRSHGRRVKAAFHRAPRPSTNKAKAIVGLFDVVQSVDRLEAGLAIEKAARALGRSVRVLVQVNVSPAERFGVAPAGAAHLAQQLRGEGLAVDGVMAIGPLEGDVDSAFALAREAFAEIGGTTLSLGMSADWERAIEHGSTCMICQRNRDIRFAWPAPERVNGMMSSACLQKSVPGLPFSDEELDEVDGYEVDQASPKRNVVPLSEAGRRVGPSVGVFAPRSFSHVSEISDSLRARQVAIVNLQGADRFAVATRGRLYVGRRIHDRRADTKTRRIDLSRSPGRRHRELGQPARTDERRRDARSFGTLWE